MFNIDIHTYGEQTAYYGNNPVEYNSNTQRVRQ